MSLRALGAAAMRQDHDGERKPAQHEGHGDVEGRLRDREPPADDGARVQYLPGRGCAGEHERSCRIRRSGGTVHIDGASIMIWVVRWGGNL